MKLFLHKILHNTEYYINNHNNHLNNQSVYTGQGIDYSSTGGGAKKPLSDIIESNISGSSTINHNQQNSTYKIQTNHKSDGNHINHNNHHNKTNVNSNFDTPSESSEASNSESSADDDGWESGESNLRNASNLKNLQKNENYYHTEDNYYCYNVNKNNSNNNNCPTRTPPTTTTVTTLSSDNDIDKVHINNFDSNPIQLPPSSKKSFTKNYKFYSKRRNSSNSSSSCSSTCTSNNNKILFSSSSSTSSLGNNNSNRNNNNNGNSIIKKNDRVNSFKIINRKENFVQQSNNNNSNINNNNNNCSSNKAAKWLKNMRSDQDIKENLSNVVNFRVTTTTTSSYSSSPKNVGGNVSNENLESDYYSSICDKQLSFVGSASPCKNIVDLVKLLHVQQSPPNEIDNTVKVATENTPEVIVAKTIDSNAIGFFNQKTNNIPKDSNIDTNNSSLKNRLFNSFRFKNDKVSTLPTVGESSSSSGANTTNEDTTSNANLLIVSSNSGVHNLFRKIRQELQSELKNSKNNNTKPIP